MLQNNIGKLLTLTMIGMKYFWIVVMVSTS